MSGSRGGQTGGGRGALSVASRAAGCSPVSRVPAASAPEVPSHPLSRARTEKGRPASTSRSPCHGDRAWRDGESAATAVATGGPERSPISKGLWQRLAALRKESTGSGWPPCPHPFSKPHPEKPSAGLGTASAPVGIAIEAAEFPGKRNTREERSLPERKAETTHACPPAELIDETQEEGKQSKYRPSEKPGGTGNTE